MLSALRDHWKHFLWMWALPGALFANASLPSRWQDPISTFVELPLFGAFFWIAYQPLARGRRSHLFTMGGGAVVVPFFIWRLLLLGSLGIDVLLGRRMG